MKPRWLNRALLVGPYYTLCLTEQAYLREVKRMKVAAPDPWVHDGKDATVHHFTAPHGLASVVCLRYRADHEPLTIAGVLVHEAVHIWQQWCDEVGEHAPGREQEACAIQWLAQELMAEFVRQTGGKA